MVRNRSSLAPQYNEDDRAQRFLAIEDVEALIRLLATAADPTVEMPLAQRKRKLLEGVAAMIDADAWLWVTGRTNPNLPGDSMVVGIVDGGWSDEHERAKALRVIIHPDLQRLATIPLYRAVLELRTFTESRDQLISEEQWQASATGKAWRAAGFDHFVLSVYPLGATMHSALGFHRRVGKPAFTERDRTIVHITVQQVDWLHRKGSNVPASEKVIDLSPRERQVMLLLMGGDSRKQVAAKLDLSEHTVADYLKEIYRKLDVSSRAELLAKFIPSG